jgi:hypothetical protein
MAEVKIDRRFQARLVEEFLSKLLPEWAPGAACARSKPSDPPIDLWFTDDVTDLGEETQFPDLTAHDAMRICATCNFKRECVTWAYEMENDPYDPWSESTDADNDRMGIFLVPGRIRERFASYPDRIERCLRWFYDLAGSPERRWCVPPREYRKREESA